MIIGQAEIDSWEQKDEGGRLVIPPETVVSDGCHFPTVTAGARCMFGKDCTFADGSDFGVLCTFGAGCIFEGEDSFGKGCLFGANCTISDNSTVGDFASFGENCSFGRNCSLGRACAYGRDCSFGPLSGWGSGSLFGPGCTAQDPVWSHMYDIPFHVTGRVYPPPEARSHWEQRLGISLADCCWGEIERRIIPLLPRLLRRKTWTPVERQVLESWRAGEVNPTIGERNGQNYGQN
jgi:hypothetical protein